MVRTARPITHTDLLIDVGLRIRWARELVFPNQTEAAALFGVSQPQLHRIEAGTRAPSIFHLVAISNRLRVSTDYILKGILNAKTDPEMALKLAAMHPELVLQHMNTGTGKDTPPPSDTRPQPRK